MFVFFCKLQCEHCFAYTATTSEYCHFAMSITLLVYLMHFNKLGFAIIEFYHEDYLKSIVLYCNVCYYNIKIKSSDK